MTHFASFGSLTPGATNAPGIVSLVVSSIQHNKTVAILEVKIDDLTKRVDKHNNTIERVYELERVADVHEEKIKVANHRIDDLEDAKQNK